MKTQEGSRAVGLLKSVFSSAIGRASKSIRNGLSRLFQKGSNLAHDRGRIESYEKAFGIDETANEQIRVTSTKSPYVPGDFQDGINRAYSVGCEIVRSHRRLGEPVPEVAAVARSVEEHRWAWRPETVRVVLIAESHVYTRDTEVRLKIARDRLPDDARHTPSSFCRFVYCLAYGDSGLLVNNRGLTSSNGGTPQYWELFSRFGVPKRQSNQPVDSSIESKTDILNTLKRRGIWLLDASVHAVYCPGGIRRSDEACAALHKSWLEHYGERMLRQTKPNYVCVVGKGVYRVLHDLGLKIDHWIYQPRARVPKSMHDDRIAQLLADIQ